MDHRCLVRHEQFLGDGEICSYEKYRKGMSCNITAEIYPAELKKIGKTWPNASSIVENGIIPTNLKIWRTCKNPKSGIKVLLVGRKHLESD